MGLKITTIERLPIATDRDYYIYFLDYGWEEPLSQALYNNFDIVASFAAENKSLLISGLYRREFANEILSWHHINGENAEKFLPAVMVSDCDPRALAGSNESFSSEKSYLNRSTRNPIPARFILIPLREVCKTQTDVVDVLGKLMNDIRHKREICNFELQNILNHPERGLSEAFVLRPSLYGVGVDLKELWRLGSNYFKARRTGADD
ncbi:hypothetical protein [Ancylobacter amanitiformis]|uniref:Uncharacterized protein n=1 Tax=Ancylobacter amanitiformis TaxID=217069 RepID=A0ABU0LNP4_9HYPH|nr:hypothetical protein [Ancylobacter amanitiformis]MDQ0510323.1 hypothetical protein [Ancylobacter amanitiformis]